MASRERRRVRSLPNQIEVIGQLLDRGYTGATRQVIQALFRMSTGGIMRERLGQLDARAVELSENGQKFVRNDPVVRALLADMQDIATRQALLVDAAAADVQASGVQVAGQTARQLALPGLSDEALATLRVGWNVPDPEALQAAVNFISNPAWQAEIEAFAPGVVSAVNRAALQGILMGQGPLQTARDIRRLVEGMPVHTANNLMRTLQLEAYRNANLVYEVSNADILSHKVRIAALDDRTCMACISLHGERLELGQSVDDHHQGRCTSVMVTKGRDLTVQTGEEWFNGLPPERRERIAGGANFRALDSGRVQLRDFVGTYRDPVFGGMIREMSLVGVLGDDAQQFYVVGRGGTEVLTFEQFATRRGAPEFAGDVALHRMPGVSPGQRRRIMQREGQRLVENVERRDELQAEYDRLVASGRVRPPSRLEALRARARGHPDNESTQAARRILRKRGLSF